MKSYSVTIQMIPLKSVLSNGATCFSKYYKMKFGIFYRIVPLATFGSEWVK